jgi:broad specificity phosphatase PhoE
MNDPERPRLRAWQDTPLIDEGRADIQLTANKLKIYAPKIVYSSDLGRDTESAMLIAEILGNIPYETNFALRTADMGQLTGMAEKDILSRIRRWYENGGEPAPGGGEARFGFERRVWQFLEPKIELARMVAAFRPSVFVTHGRIEAYLDSYYNMKAPEDGLMPLPGGYGVLRSNPSGLDSFELIGETEPILTDV